MQTNADICPINYRNFILILKKKNFDIVCCRSVTETKAHSVNKSKTFLYFWFIVL